MLFVFSKCHPSTETRSEVSFYSGEFHCTDRACLQHVRQVRDPPPPGGGGRCHGNRPYTMAVNAAAGTRHGSLCPWSIQYTGLSGPELKIHLSRSLARSNTTKILPVVWLDTTVGYNGRPRSVGLRFCKNQERHVAVKVTPRAMRDVAGIGVLCVFVLATRALSISYLSIYGLAIY